MARWRRLAALLLVAFMVLAPALADARAGGGYRSGGGSSYSSQGSRGSRTYESDGGQAMQRSLTPQSQASPSAGQYGYGSSHPFLTGLAGGLLGGWLGSMFFPHWGMGYGGGFGGVLGSVFSWLLIIGLGWMVFRFFARRMAPALSGAAGAMPYGGLGSGMGLGLGSTASRGAPLAIAHVDYEAFETVLKHVQGAWSTGDLGNLRHFVTPEMLSYFADQLAENESQGVVNHVEQVEMLRGDLREAWDEGRLQYATCMLHWRALDYTVRNGRSPGDPDAIVSGDRQNPSEAAELWTFARSPGGQWLLSAIQQV